MAQAGVQQVGWGKGVSVTPLHQPLPALLRGAWLSQGASCHQRGSGAQVGGTCLPGTSLPWGRGGHPMPIPCLVLTGRPWCSSASRRENR